MRKTVGSDARVRTYDPTLGLPFEHAPAARISGVREQQNLYHATEILIEDKASGTQLIQELIANSCHAVTRALGLRQRRARRYSPRCDDDPDPPGR